MLDTIGPDHPLYHNIQEILKAKTRAADLTRQLLAFSRKQMQSLRVLNLNKVVQDICRVLPRLIGEDVEVSFVAGQDLADVKADPVQIEQILMNLATNARNAMPQGGRLSIETRNVVLDAPYVQTHSMVPLGEYVQLSISDSGHGID